jgi:hypothetical protein
MLGLWIGLTSGHSRKPYILTTQDIFKAVQNAHRMHPGLVSSELVAGARARAELSGAMLGGEPHLTSSDVPDSACPGWKQKTLGRKQKLDRARAAWESVKGLGLEPGAALERPMGRCVFLKARIEMVVVIRGPTDLPTSFIERADEILSLIHHGARPHDLM